MLDDVLVLLSTRTRRKLIGAIIGSLVVAGAEVVGVAAFLPLMRLITYSENENGAFITWLISLTGADSRADLVSFLSTLAFGAFLLKGLLTIAFRWWMLGFVYEQEAETSAELLRYYIDAPYSLHLRRSSAELIRTMNDAVGQVYAMVVVSGVSAFVEAATIAVVLATLLVLMPLPTLAAIVYFGLAAVIYLKGIRTRAMRYGDIMNESSVRIYKSAMHALGGVKEIKVRHNGEFFLSRFRDARLAHAAARRRATFVTEIPKFFIELLFIAGVGVAALFVFRQHPTGYALSLLAVFVAAGFRVLPSLVRMLASINATRVGRPALALVSADVREMRAFRAAAANSGSASSGSANSGAATSSSAVAAGPTSKPTPVAREIGLEELSFRYHDGTVDVIDQISLQIRAGTSLAIVGGSGAGKSTLVDLLLGLHTPTSGRITVDGADIADDLVGWQRTLAMVPQDVYLLDDSLLANIVFGEDPEHLDRARLDAAIAGAQLEELVASLPRGVESDFGERGVRLSGGQRQRIGIARALYHDPAVLVLDEATSALDNETERRITDTIAALSGRLTVIVVAHRLSTVRDCDQMIFLRDGRIEAHGTFSEVQRTSPDFARLVKLGSLQLEDD